MSDTEHADSSQPAENQQEPDGTTLSVEEWIELMNKHDRLEQYAKQRREEKNNRQED